MRWSPPADHGTSVITRYAVTVADLTLHRTMVSTSVGPAVHRLRAVTLAGHHYRFTVTAYNKAGRGVTTTVDG